MQLTTPMIGIFVASWLAKLDSVVVDVIVWIVTILLFAWIILSKLHF